MVWAFLSMACRGVAAAIFGAPPLTPADIYRGAASEIKACNWQQVFEADEVACAVLARLGVPPEKWAAGMKVLRARELAELGSWIDKIEENSKADGQGSGQAAQVAADQMAARMGWPSIDEGLAQLKAALAKENLSELRQQHSRWNTIKHWQELVDAADEEDNFVVVGKTVVSSHIVAGPIACPEPAALAILSDLAETSPPIETRIQRIQLLATQPPMRTTVPPVEVGSLDEPSSIAQAIADRAVAGLKAVSRA